METTTTPAEHDHHVVIVATPEDRRKPLCSCGWQGERRDSQADAELDANAHIAGAIINSI